MRYALAAACSCALIFAACTVAFHRATTRTSEGDAEIVAGPLLGSPIHALLDAGSDVVYAASEDSGVIRSTNGGTNWQRYSAGLGAPYISALAQNSRGDIFAATIGNGIYELPAGSPVWRRADTTLAGDFLLRVPALIIAPTTNAIYAATLEHGVYRSTDNGATWNAFDDGLGILNINALAVTDPGMLYLRCVGGGVYRRAPSWDDWKPAESGMTNPFVTALGAQHNGGVFAGAHDAKAYWMDENGNEWQDISTGLPPGIINCFASAAWGTEVAGTEHGLYRYDFSSSSWVSLSKTAGEMDILSLAITRDGTVYAGTRRNGIIIVSVKEQ